MTRFHSTALGFILAVCSVSTHACEPGDQGCGVEKTDWLKFMKQSMPMAFCADTSPYVQCAQKGEPPCLELAASAVNACIAENEPRIPLLLNRAESSDWGSALGDCAGRQMFPSMSFASKACKELLEPVAATDEEKILERSQQLIARSPELSRLDKQLKGVFLRVYASDRPRGIDTDASNANVVEQLRWEHTLARNCSSPACIEKAYLSRISDLKRKLK